MQTRQESVGKRTVIRFHPLSFAFGPTNVRLLPVGSSAYIRIRSPSFAYVRIQFFYLWKTSRVGKAGFRRDAESNPPEAGATRRNGGVWGRQILPGGGGLRRAPECVMANSPEYATLEGLKHRDSPEYVTKKISTRGVVPARVSGLSNQPKPSKLKLCRLYDHVLRHPRSFGLS